MPTPNLYAEHLMNPYDDLAPELRTTDAEVVYFSDRAGQENALKQILYGYERSPVLVAGVARVKFGNRDLTWDDLRRNSLTSDRDTHIDVGLTGSLQHIQFPATPYEVVSTSQGLAVAPAVRDAEAQAERELRELIERKLASTKQKNLYLFIHGYNNSFAESAVRMGELWHFMGRRGVPIIYSWPAGSGGLRGYFFDRESGEFTVYHLKQTLRRLAAIPGVQNIHILAHSRGCDVALSAIRELVIEQRAAGHNPRATLKLANLVLAAPDLDYDVATQRITAERLGEAVGRTTIYVSQSDRALGLSNWLFGSVQRLGRLTLTDLLRLNNGRPEIVQGTAIVDARVTDDWIGHAYFHSDPAVSSDLILMMAYNLDAGAQYGRPLEKMGPYYWSIYKGYPEPNNLLGSDQHEP